MTLQLVNVPLSRVASMLINLLSRTLLQLPAITIQFSLLCLWSSQVSYASPQSIYHPALSLHQSNPDEDMAGVIANQTRPLRSTPGSSRFACATKIVGEAPWSHRSTLVLALVAMLTEIYYAGAVPPSARRPPSLATFLAAPTILFCARSCDMEAASPTHRASLAVGIISHILAKPWTPF